MEKNENQEIVNEVKPIGKSKKNIGNTEEIQKIKEEKDLPKKIENEKKEISSKKKIKKIKEAVVNAESLPISKKFSVYICKFIKNKKIHVAIMDLEQVLRKKKAIPMTGEYAHKKSVKKFASGGGKYPQNATKIFVGLLKSLATNANVLGIEDPIISKAIANFAPRPKARFGRWKRKRTHIQLSAIKMEKKK